MRRKKPVRASIDQVRITREGTTAVIDHADPTMSGVNLTIGDAIHGMTDQQILAVYNNVLAAQQQSLRDWDNTVIEIPPGKPQIKLSRDSGQWVPQGEHIHAKVVAAQAAGQPVISVDTKKKELVGNYKNGGSDIRPKGKPVRVNVHDFVDEDLGKAVPCGVYDIAANDGFVSVGIPCDTAEFAVQSIRCWRDRMGAERYPTMSELTITADGGGSVTSKTCCALSCSRLRLWKVEPQKFADETNLIIHVNHYPPGTSKWNKIEHRMFCHIPQNWRGRPLTDRIAIVELIGATTTKAGLKIECALDTRTYEKGIEVSDAEMDTLNITGAEFHPEWNHTIRPRQMANSERLSFGESLWVECGV